MKMSKRMARHPELSSAASAVPSATKGCGYADDVVVIIARTTRDRTPYDEWTPRD